MTKQCKQCNAAFEITATDLAFYDKVSPVFGGKKYQIPPPTLCPDCRKLRRYSWRNERFLYPRTCDLCHRDIISIFRSDHSFPVYCAECWNSDRWDALKYGQGYDPSQPFFKQYSKLLAAVPQSGVSVIESENCEYNVNAGYSKNCYLCYRCFHSENCYYSYFVQKCKDCLDCYRATSCELCFEVINCEHSYNLAHSDHSTGCRDGYFLSHCHNCSNCFGCINLRNKKYYLYNQKYTPGEYRQELAKILKDLPRAINKYQALKQQAIYSENHNSNSEECIGDYLSNCKSCHDCFNCANGDHLAYCTDSIFGLNASYDCTIGKGELCYECIGGDAGINALFSFFTKGSSYTRYSHTSFNCNHIFGCVGIRKKEYCILNKQYTKEQYEDTSAQIIKQMSRQGEWGEYMPSRQSMFYYTESIADEHYPAEENKDGIKVKGYAGSFSIPKEALHWDGTIKQVKKEDQGNLTMRNGDRERLIRFDGKVYERDVSKTEEDELRNRLFVCAETGKLYKLIEQELEFYRKRRYPLPIYHPNVRHRYRATHLNPFYLWQRTCAKCREPIQTTYAPERPEIVYCEKCYQETIN